MTIKLESGAIRQLDGRYRYDYTTVADGYQVVFFTVNPGEVPEIGDFIVNNKLKKKEGIQKNNQGRMRWGKDNSDEYIQFGKLYEK